MEQKLELLATFVMHQKETSFHQMVTAIWQKQVLLCLKSTVGHKQVCITVTLCQLTVVLCSQQYL